MKTHPSCRSGERGAVLIVALILSAILAISLASYIHLSNQSLKLADRTFRNLTAMNLTDVGLEEAVYSFNQIDDTSLSAAWTGWTITGNNATRTFSGFNAGQNATGVIKVYVQNYNASGATQPVVVAKSIVTPAGGPPMEKWVEIVLKRRSYFSNGLIAKDSVTLLSNVYVDSFKSDSDDNPATPGVQYSAALRRDNGFVGCIATGNGAIDISNSNVAVYGRVSSGGGNITVGPNTSVYDSNDGATSHPPSPRIYDASLVTKDFSATFPAVTPPTPSATNNITTNYFVNQNRTLPRAGDVAASDGRYYYTFASGRNISLTSNYTLTINDKVTFIMTNHHGANAIELTSNDRINLGTGGNVEVYTNGNIRADSNTRINSTKTAADFSIYGTNTGTGQTFTFNSNTLCNFSVYGPNAAVFAGSNAQISGSIIAKSIRCDSNAVFHYDESLSQVVAGNPFGIVKWRELTTAGERAGYASQLSF